MPSDENITTLLVNGWGAGAASTRGTAATPVKRATTVSSTAARERACDLTGLLLHDPARRRWPWAAGVRLCDLGRDSSATMHPQTGMDRLALGERR
jgi:hypothetical protein